MKCQHNGCDLDGDECTINNERGDEVSPSIESLPIAMGFLQGVADDTNN